MCAEIDARAGPGRRRSLARGGRHRRACRAGLTGPARRGGSWTIVAVIREISISAKGEDDDQYYEPPARVLNLTVVGGDACLSIYEHGVGDRAADPIASVDPRALAAAGPDRCRRGRRARPGPARAVKRSPRWPFTEPGGVVRPALVISGPAGARQDQMPDRRDVSRRGATRRAACPGFMVPVSGVCMLSGGSGGRSGCRGGLAAAAWCGAAGGLAGCGRVGQLRRGRCPGRFRRVRRGPAGRPGPG